MRPCNRQHKGEKTTMISQNPSKVLALYDEDFSNIITGLIERAEKKIYITTYKLEPRKGPKAQRINSLISEIFKATSRGIDIKIMLNFYENHKATSNINWYAARLFQRNGIIIKYQNSGRTLHQKLILIDNVYIIAGSHNLSVQSLAQNIELSFLIEDDTIYQKCETKFLTLWESAKDFPWCK